MRLMTNAEPVGEVHTEASRAIITIGHHVLVARGYAESFTHMPGGHIDQGEMPLAALHRELNEEIGRPAINVKLVAEIDHAFVRSYDHMLEKQHSYIYLVKLAPVMNELRQHSKETKLRYEWYPIHELWRANLQPPEMVSIIQKFASL